MEIWIPVLKKDGTRKTEEELRAELDRAKKADEMKVKTAEALVKVGEILAKPGIRKVLEQ